MANNEGSKCESCSNLIPNCLSCLRSDKVTCQTCLTGHSLNNDNSACNESRTNFIIYIAGGGAAIFGLLVIWMGRSVLIQGIVRYSSLGRND